MNDESLIQDFFRDARKRAAKKSSEPPVAVRSEEDNTLYATMGFGFRCGVCGRRHTSASTDKVPALKLCIEKIVRKYGYYQQQVKYTTIMHGKGRGNSRRYKVRQYMNPECRFGWNTRFLPDLESPDALVITYLEKTVLEEAVPKNDLFAVFYPKLHAEAVWGADRFGKVWSRELTRELPMREILAAPDSMAFVDQQRSALMEDITKESERLRADQEREAGELLLKLRDYRALPVEKFAVNDIEHGHWKIKSWHRKRPPGDPISRLRLNGTPIDYERVLRSFVGEFTLDHPVHTAQTRMCGESMAVLFDVRLMDGEPAVSWGMAQVQKKSRRTYVGTATVNFVTYWSGRTYLNLGFARSGPLLSDIAKDRSLVEVLLRKKTGEEPVR